MDYDSPTKEKLLKPLIEFCFGRKKKDDLTKYCNTEPAILQLFWKTYTNPHNASAVLRSCDLTGVQDVHIIENKNEYEVNPEVATWIIKMA